MTEANVKVNGISVVLVLNNDSQVEKNKIIILFIIKQLKMRNTLFKTILFVDYIYLEFVGVC